MFMMSFRLKKLAVAISGVVLAALVFVGAAQVVGLIRGDAVAADSSPKGSAFTSASRKIPGKTNEDRLAFVRSFGWEVEEDASEIMEVIIPKEFDDVYTQYNAIQKKQGCDLEKISGKRCKRYSYIVTNYPGTEEAVRINILVYKNKIVGGDVCSMDVNGFIHGFEMPQ